MATKNLMMRLKSILIGRNNMENNILEHRIAVGQNIIKSFDDNDIEKAIKIYADTPENRKLGRVGQQYGKEKKVDLTLTRKERSEITQMFNKFKRKHYEGNSALNTEEGKKLISELKKYGVEKVGYFFKRKYETTLSEGSSFWYDAAGEAIMGEKAWNKMLYDKKD